MFKWVLFHPIISESHLLSMHVRLTLQVYDLNTKRKTIKVWLTVFCCATTSTVNIKLMGDYSTTAFVFSFIRFACEVGYPKVLLIDDGSQLVKGCENMKLDFVDIKHKLHKEMAVEFEVCPVGGHNVNGKVERRICHIKESLEKLFIMNACQY